MRPKQCLKDQANLQKMGSFTRAQAKERKDKMSADERKINVAQMDDANNFMWQQIVDQFCCSEMAFEQCMDDYKAMMEMHSIIRLLPRSSTLLISWAMAVLTTEAVRRGLAPLQND